MAVGEHSVLRRERGRTTVPWPLLPDHMLLMMFRLVQAPMYPLLRAAVQSKVDVMRWLLSELGADPDVEVGPARIRTVTGLIV